MEYLIYFIIIIFLLFKIVEPFLDSFNKKKQKIYSDQLKENISKVVDFSSNHIHISPNGFQALSIDTNRQVIGLFENWANNFIKHLYHYTDIIEVSIIENNEVESTTKTSRSSQVIGTAVGGFLLGGTGAIIGGLSGKKTTSSQEFVTSLSLRIVIDDLSNPVFTVPFIEGQILKKDSEYQSIKNNISKWNGLLTIFLKRSEQLSAEQFSKEKELAKQISKNNSIESDSSFKEELASLSRSGNKIEAIKRYRQKANIGLKEAKDYIDSL